MTWTDAHNSARPLMRSVLRLASGEIPARLCGIATLLLLARRWGVVMVGLYALAQGMIGYTYPFIDFGLRHVGARLIARYPQAGREIVGQVQKRRGLMSLAIVPFLLGYALLTNLSASDKVFLFLFSAISCLYSTSLEWAAWGKEHLRLVGFGRIVVPGSVLLFLLLGGKTEHPLPWMVAGNAVGYCTQGLIFWAWWRKNSPPAEQTLSIAAVRESLAWTRTSIMGLAWFCNLAFNTIDMLMLGVMSNAHQVGLYSAAYRTMNQVLITYYLLIQVLYPQQARQQTDQRTRSLHPGILFSLAAAGIIIAIGLGLSRTFVIRVVFGAKFLAASVLLSLLVWAIPLDFLTSYLSNAYIAWGMEKKVLACTLIGAASNVVLNLIWIPKYAATAAAANTLASYVIFLVSLAVAGRYSSEIGRMRGPAQPQAEAAGSSYGSL